MQRAKIISDGLKQIMPLVHSHKICLVFINQIRDRIGVMYGEKIDTVGGMSIKFQSSLRLHCRLVGKIKGDKSGEMIGNKGRLVVGKSKVCKPFRLVNFDMLVDKPIDEFSGLLDYYVRHGQIESNRGWYNLPDDDNKWRESDFPKIYKENKKYFEGAK
jgi:recombination protein RecA